MVIKLSIKYKIIRQCHIFENILYQNSLLGKGFINIFYRAENKMIARQLTIPAFIYYLIYSGVRKAFPKISNTRKLDLSCSMEVYHFKKLP